VQRKLGHVKLIKNLLFNIFTGDLEENVKSYKWETGYWCLHEGSKCCCWNATYTFWNHEVQAETFTCMCEVTLVRSWAVLSGPSWLLGRSRFESSSQW